MFWKKKQEVLEDNTILESDESESECDLNFYILGEPLYEMKVLNGIKFEKYITNISKMKNEINKWEFNRNISKEHVQNIVSAIREQKYPHLMGSIKIVKSIEDSTCKLIDGMHRFTSLIQLREEDPNFDIEVEVDIYYVPDINDNLQLNDLFKRANNNKNIEEKEMPGTKIIEVIDKMIKKWPQNIKTGDGAGAYRPNITRRDLYLALKSRIEQSKQNSDEIFARIIVINDLIGSTNLKKLFGKDKVADRKIRIYEKAQKNKFYLNMDCLMNKEWWVSQIKI